MTTHWHCPACGRGYRLTSKDFAARPVQCVCGHVVHAWSPAAKAAQRPQRGRQVLSESQVESRLAICRQCPSGFYTGGVCRICPSCQGQKQAAFERLLRFADAQCPARHWGRQQPVQPSLIYISSTQRTIDTLCLMRRLPHDLAAICGIARSGLAPAVELAMALHLPLYILSEKGVFEPGCGYRLMGQEKPGDGPILLVDDSLGTGRSLRRALPIARRQWPDRRLLTAVIYRNMLAKVRCDFWSRELGEHHLFEWNLFNSPFWTGKVGFDFDGVLCRDGARRPSEAQPLNLPRRDEIPLIVTGRHEHARAESEAWLARWRVRVRRMVMWPGGDLLAERQGILAVSRYKADYYHAASDLALYVESDERQAREIAQLTGKAVLCPAVGRVLTGEPSRPPEAFADE